MTNQLPLTAARANKLPQDAIEKQVLVCGPVPPPAHGQALATQSLVVAFRQAGLSVTLMDTSEGVGRLTQRWATKTLRFSRALSAMCIAPPGAAAS